MPNLVNCNLTTVCVAEKDSSALVVELPRRPLTEPLARVVLRDYATAVGVAAVHLLHHRRLLADLDHLIAVVVGGVAYRALPQDLAGFEWARRLLFAKGFRDLHTAHRAVGDDKRQWVGLELFIDALLLCESAVVVIAGLVLRFEVGHKLVGEVLPVLEGEGEHGRNTDAGFRKLKE